MGVDHFTVKLTYNVLAMSRSKLTSSCKSRGTRRFKSVHPAEHLLDAVRVPIPRTSTLLNDFRANPRFGTYTASLLDDGGFQWPRDGRGDDGAHPPIHPTTSVDPNTLQPDERKVSISLDLSWRSSFVISGDSLPRAEHNGSGVKILSSWLLAERTAVKQIL